MTAASDTTRSASATPPALAPVITGMGAVTAHGFGLGAVWSGLVAGADAIGPITVFDSEGHRTKHAAEAPQHTALVANAPPYARPRWELTRADRFAVFAAEEALTQAELIGESASSHARARPGLGPRVGVFFGSSTGGLLESESFFRALCNGDRPLRAGRLAAQQANGPGDAVARAFGVRGPVETLSTACVSSAMAAAAAMDALACGEVDVALVGGADSLCCTTHAGFNALRSVDPDRTRPFRADRAGLSLGEGSAVLVLESASHAASRGAQILATLHAAVANCDAHHMSAPHPEGLGLSAAVRRALGAAGVRPEQIAFVNAHGTGTRANDQAEARALRAVFGDRADALPLTSTKSLVGHLLGASGALELVATVLCLMHGVVHPVAGGGLVDPEALVDLVLHAPRRLPATVVSEASDVRFALTVNLAFGGANTALVVGAAESAALGLGAVRDAMRETDPVSDSRGPGDPSIGATVA